MKLLGIIVASRSTLGVYKKGYALFIYPGTMQRSGKDVQNDLAFFSLSAVDKIMSCVCFNISDVLNVV